MQKQKEIESIGDEFVNSLTGEHPNDSQANYVKWLENELAISRMSIKTLILCQKSNIAALKIMDFKTKNNLTQPK